MSNRLLISLAYSIHITLFFLISLAYSIHINTYHTSVWEFLDAKQKVGSATGLLS
jgi:hypothetical protein